MKHVITDCQLQPSIFVRNYNHQAHSLLGIMIELHNSGTELCMMSKMWKLRNYTHQTATKGGRYQIY